MTWGHPANKRQSGTHTRPAGTPTIGRQTSPQSVQMWARSEPQKQGHGQGLRDPCSPGHAQPKVSLSAPSRTFLLPGGPWDLTQGLSVVKPLTFPTNNSRMGSGYFPAHLARKGHVHRKRALATMRHIGFPALNPPWQPSLPSGTLPFQDLAQNQFGHPNARATSWLLRDWDHHLEV